MYRTHLAADALDKDSQLDLGLPVHDYASVRLVDVLNDACPSGMLVYLQILMTAAMCCSPCTGLAVWGKSVQCTHETSLQLGHLGGAGVC